MVHVGKQSLAQKIDERISKTKTVQEVPRFILHVLQFKRINLTIYALSGFSLLIIS